MPSVVVAVKMGVATLLDKTDFPGPEVMQDQVEPVQRIGGMDGFVLSVVSRIAPTSVAESAFPQAVVRVPRQRREQIADNPARAGFDFDGDGHAG